MKVNKHHNVDKVPTKKMFSSPLGNSVLPEKIGVTTKKPLPKKKCAH